MFQTIITLGLGVAGIYFFYQGNFVIGVGLLGWALSRQFGGTLQRTAKAFGEIFSHSELERKSNNLLEFRISIEEVLGHQSVTTLFEKLKKSKVIAANVTLDEWRKKLLGNYQQKYSNDDVFEKVKFNIKNNLVWKNEKIDFNDAVYHEVVIPYQHKKGEKEEHLFGATIEKELTVRVFIVNGLIKLQVGDFNKAYTPKMLREEGLAVYRTQETLTTFPLMYFSHQHKIPTSYLNLSAYATDSWAERHVAGTEGKKEFTDDLKEINKDIADYEYVCALADEYVSNTEKWMAIVKRFDEKKQTMLTQNGFSNPFARKDDDWVPDWMEDNSISYFNKYLNVFVSNLNEYKDKRAKYTYTDYYEEHP